MYICTRSKRRTVLVCCEGSIQLLPFLRGVLKCGLVVGVRLHIAHWLCTTIFCLCFRFSSVPLLWVLRVGGFPPFSASGIAVGSQLLWGLRVCKYAPKFPHFLCSLLLAVLLPARIAWFFPYGMWVAGEEGWGFVRCAFSLFGCMLSSSVCFFSGRLEVPTFPVLLGAGSRYFAFVCGFCVLPAFGFPPASLQDGHCQLRRPESVHRCSPVW